MIESTTERLPHGHSGEAENRCAQVPVKSLNNGRIVRTNPILRANPRDK